MFHIFGDRLVSGESGKASPEDHSNWTVLILMRPYCPYTSTRTRHALCTFSSDKWCLDLFSKTA